MSKKCLSVLTALMLVLTIAAAYGQSVEDPVLATFEGRNILKSEVDEVMPMLEDYMTDAIDYRYASEFVVQQYMIEQKIKDLGFDTFTPEEEAVFKADAQAFMDESIESYVSYYLSEDSDEAREQLRLHAEESYLDQGMTLEALEDDFRQSAAIDKLSSYLVGDYKPSEEEIEATFNQFGEAYRENYENDIMAYEYNTNYYQQPSWYTPEGYRGIIHILLHPDNEVMDNYTRLSSAYEEQQSENMNELTQAQEPLISEDQMEAEAVVAVTLETVEAAKQAVLDASKEEINSIYDKLAKGESFESLIAQYGQDPGMQDENNLEDGYQVHQESIVWDPAFTAGAFSEKMQKVGDISDPIVGSNGIHILMYKTDVPSGLIMTDSIHLEITEYLEGVNENSALANAIEEWSKEYTIVYHEDSILAATLATQAMELDDEAGDTENPQVIRMEEQFNIPEETDAPVDAD